MMNDKKLEHLLKSHFNNVPAPQENTLEGVRQKMQNRGSLMKRAANIAGSAMVTVLVVVVLFVAGLWAVRRNAPNDINPAGWDDTSLACICDGLLDVAGANENVFSEGILPINIDGIYGDLFGAPVRVVFDENTLVADFRLQIHGNGREFRVTETELENWGWCGNIKGVQDPEIARIPMENGNGVVFELTVTAILEGGQLETRKARVFFYITPGRGLGVVQYIVEPESGTERFVHAVRAASPAESIYEAEYSTTSTIGIIPPEGERNRYLVYILNNRGQYVDNGTLEAGGMFPVVYYGDLPPDWVGQQVRLLEDMLAQEGLALYDMGVKWEWFLPGNNIVALWDAMQNENVTRMPAASPRKFYAEGWVYEVDDIATALPPYTARLIDADGNTVDISDVIASPELAESMLYALAFLLQDHFTAGGSVVWEPR